MSIQVNTYYVAKSTKLPISEKTHAVAFTGNCSTWGDEPAANECASNEAERIAKNVGGKTTLLGEKDLDKFHGIRMTGNFLRALEVEKDGEIVALIFATK